MAKNGRSAATVSPNVGMVRQQLKEPEQAGTISVAEAQELRERKRLREAQEERFKTKQEEVQDIAKMITLMRLEYVSFLQGLLRDRELNLTDDYDVQSESGIIWRTATQVAPEPVSVTETEPVLAAVPDAAKE